MVLCLFGLRYRRDANLEAEADLAGRLLRELEAQPGFISYHQYSGEDGEMLGVVRFESPAALERWRDNQLHRSAWGRASEFYEEFWIQDAETYREYDWADSKRHDRDLSARFRRTRKLSRDRASRPSHE
jgi:heme-degrading monooxygenase HmoA